MKCLILAGGCGDRLWPLSRKNYPKQFMNIKDGRSLLQETVARNIPFCDEFIIVTNRNYNFIIEAQMEVFQGLKYRLFYEEESKKTAAAITLACFFCEEEETVFVVTADNIIEGEEYKHAILKAQDLSQQGHLVTFGIKASFPQINYGYIEHEGEDVISFKEKPDYNQAFQYIVSGNYLWNSGMFLFQIKDYFNELKTYSKEVYETCKYLSEQMDHSMNHIVFPSQLMHFIPAISVEHAVFEYSNNLKVVLSKFDWCDIGDFEGVIDYAKLEDDNQIIKENCNNVSIINRASKKLIVVNGISEAVIVNTEDALYISKKSAMNDIKEIMKKSDEKYRLYFEDNTLLYRPWGTYEVVNAGIGYKVKKVTIYPGRKMDYHKHKYRSEHWSVVKGEATVTFGEATKTFAVNESIYIPIGEGHDIMNQTDSELIIIEVSVGKKVIEDDKISISSTTKEEILDNTIVKLLPAYKDYLWGGTKLVERFNKKFDSEILAESWELSTHPAGQSKIAEGVYQGMDLGEYVNRLGRNSWGWKCQAFEQFPILIKLIDAKQALSVQVHPDDDYALRMENEYGKNEMWYVLECEKKSSLYCGTKMKIDKEELKTRIENNTLLEILSEVKVKKGDVIFVEAGTIHAIGAGIMICEVQQSSNSTYRLYDYNRKDQFGNTRELHLNKALQVTNTTSLIRKNDTKGAKVLYRNYSEQLLGQCKYFSCSRFDCLKEMNVKIDESSFVSILFIEGNGEIGTELTQLKYEKGDSFFIPAGNKSIHIKGKSSFILTHL